MRRILNLLITGLILWGASKLFPSVVQAGSIGIIALASILLWLTRITLVYICAIIVAVGALYRNLFWVIAGIILVFFTQIIALAILSRFLPGFAVIGFWPKVAIALCYSLLALEAPPNNDDQVVY